MSFYNQRNVVERNPQVGENQTSKSHIFKMFMSQMTCYFSVSVMVSSWLFAQYFGRHEWVALCGPTFGFLYPFLPCISMIRVLSFFPYL